MCRSAHSAVSTRRTSGHVVKSSDTPNSRVDSRPRRRDFQSLSRHEGRTAVRHQTTTKSVRVQRQRFNALDIRFE